MTVHFIGAGPGAPDLLTIRGRDIISQCPVCLYAGSLIPEEILSYCPSNARIINTALLDLDGIIEECINATKAGQNVARLHSGDLSVWSAMAEQIRRLKEANIEVSVTPGVPSFAAAAAAVGAELTLPGLVQSVVLTRTPGRASAMPETENLESFAKTGATLAIHLSIHNLEYVTKTLTPYYGKDCPVAIIYRASWPDQQIILGQLSTIETLLSKEIERTAIIIVGRALANQSFDESSLYASNYNRRFRPTTAQEGN
ncbi:MAG: precorrin-4 C(11)-methyltransferase [Alphaproteobacteria bacterium]|nr:precorrin-4 C(11)-methyltransferase [Alphaproteobacteria bacterium]